ncbi:RND transporter [Desulfurella acetivorans A63]|nr:RND transporter [Desulfurella acetivorans A63]
MKNKIILALGLATFLSSCALYSSPKNVNVQIPDQFKYSTNSTNSTLNQSWWENFNDQKLNNTIKTALDNNLNYKIAIKNIQIAQTYVGQNQSALLPTINATYSSTRNQPSKNASNSPFSNSQIYNLHQAGLSASYELDVWHQIQNSINQAKANVNLSKADADVVKLTLISNVAQTYFQLAALNLSIENFTQQLEAAKEILKLNEDKYKSGLINIEPVEDAKTQLENIKTVLNNLIKQKQLTQNTLAYYLGKYPEDFSLNPNTKDFMIESYAKLIPPQIPSSILTQRPDVKEAMYNVLSYAYAQKQALANFFPVFNLTANYGYASTNLSNFIENASNVWNFGLNILAPLFNYKKNTSIYERSKLQYEQAVLNYRNTVINAFKEVDNALASYKKDSQALISYQKNYQSAKNLYDIYKAQYEAGTVDYITYLNYKINLLNAYYNLINQNLLVKEDVISIYNALGIGLSN